MPSSSLPHPHDRMFKAVMSDLRIARDFLKHHLPASVREQLNLKKLRLTSGSFVEKELQSVISDMLYTAPFKASSEKAFLYIAVEHQSAADPLMALRMLKYTLAILEQHLKNHRNAVLPVVIPLVFYNGKHPYPYSPELFSLFGEHQALAAEQMFTRFQLIDLHQITDEELRGYQWSWLMQFLMKHIHDRDLLQRLEHVSERVRQLVAEGMNDYIITIMHYLMARAENLDHQALTAWTSHVFTPILQEKTVTIAEQLHQEGLQQGRQEGILAGIQQGIEKGIEKGRKEGQLLGERLLLKKMLTRRFGTLPLMVEKRIEQADAETLLLWGEQLLDAATLEKIFCVPVEA